MHITDLALKAFGLGISESVDVWVDGKAGGCVGELSEAQRPRIHEERPGWKPKAHGMASPKTRTWGTTTLRVLRIGRKEFKNHITNRSDWSARIGAMCAPKGSWPDPSHLIFNARLCVFQNSAFDVVDFEEA